MIYSNFFNYVLVQWMGVASAESEGVGVGGEEICINALMVLFPFSFLFFSFFFYKKKIKKKKTKPQFTNPAT